MARGSSSDDGDGDATHPLNSLHELGHRPLVQSLDLCNNALIGGAHRTNDDAEATQLHETGDSLG